MGHIGCIQSSAAETALFSTRGPMFFLVVWGEALKPIDKESVAVDIPLRYEV